MSWAVILIFIIFMLIAVVIIFRLIDANTDLEEQIKKLKDTNEKLDAKNDVYIHVLSITEEITDEALTGNIIHNNCIQATRKVNELVKSVKSN